MKNIFFTLFISTLLGSCTDPNPLKTVDIYKDDYLKLISAVKSENVDEIEKIVTQKKLNLNYADSKEGLSLLNWCLINEKEKSFEKLLALGADPKWEDRDGKFAPPIIKAAQIPGNIKYLQLCFLYSGNPNIRSKNVKGSQNQTPLFGALYSGNINNVKMVVEKGADVNLTNEDYWTPLAEAIMQDQMDLAEYLINHGADYQNLKFKDITGKELSILDLLRKNEYKLNSPSYKIKMEIVEFLKQKGLDYRNSPIPEQVKTRHKDEGDYLLKY